MSGMVYKTKPEYQRILKIRELALTNNEKYYFTGVACKRGHISKRYTNSRNCVECVARKENREAVRFDNRNITKYSYELIISSQGGMCAICESVLEEGKNQAIDHDHKTNEIRGVLCKHCNMGLGNFKDNPNSLRAAANYLETVNKRMLSAIYENS